MIPNALSLSIDDVVPIDPDKAGKSITDYLQTFGEITFFSLIVLAILSLVVAIVVAKKAGYSGWWGAISVLFPPVGLVLVLMFALFKWPSLKERDEALGILTANDLTLPSHERKAVKEAERKRSIEDEARKRMEKAQGEREKADAERAKFAASEAKRAAEVSAAPAAAVPSVGTGGAATQPTGASGVTATRSVNAPDKGAAPGAPAAAPGSVAPTVRTVRPRTSTNPTTAPASDGPSAPPKA